MVGYIFGLVEIFYSLLHLGGNDVVMVEHVVVVHGVVGQVGVHLHGRHLRHLGHGGHGGGGLLGHQTPGLHAAELGHEGLLGGGHVSGVVQVHVGDLLGLHVVVDGPEVDVVPGLHGLVDRGEGLLGGGHVRGVLQGERGGHAQADGEGLDQETVLSSNHYFAFLQLTILYMLVGNRVSTREILSLLVCVTFRSWLYSRHLHCGGWGVGWPALTITRPGPV